MFGRRYNELGVLEGPDLKSFIKTITSFPILNWDFKNCSSKFVLGHKPVNSPVLGDLESKWTTNMTRNENS